MSKEKICPLGDFCPKYDLRQFYLLKMFLPLPNYDNETNTVNANVSKRRLHALARPLPSSCLLKNLYLKGFESLSPHRFETL
jgi:hypothetical protein